MLSDRFYPEEFIINELAEKWATDGKDVTILTLMPTYPYGQLFGGYKNRLFSIEYFRGLCIKRFFAVTGYRENRLLKVLSFLDYPIFASIYVLLFGWKYERVFVYHVGALTVAIPALFAKIYGKKTVIWSQDIWPNAVFPEGCGGFGKKMIMLFLRFFVRVVYRVVDVIIVSCEPFIEIINQYAPDKKIYYCPNWGSSDVDGACKGGVEISNKINITFAGNINKKRSLDVIMRVFNLYNRNKDTAQLNVVGDGSGLEYLKNIKSTEELHDVVFWDRVSIKEIEKYYAASDVLLISLSPDKCYDLYLPAKFPTYLKTGKPILAIMNGAVPEIMSRYFVGFCARPDNQEEIMMAIDKILNLNEDDKEVIRQESLRLLNNEFNGDKIMEKISCLLCK